MKKLIVIVIALVILHTSASGQVQTGLAETPPLGWNSFDSYGVYLHEKAAYENLKAFEVKLKPFGYEYFIIDAGWWGQYELIPGTLYPAERHASNVNIDHFGMVEPGKVYFPNGLVPLIEKAHEMGIKFGVHIMRGIPRKAVQLNLPVHGTNYRARDIADTTSICTWNPQNYGIDMNKPGAQEYYNGLIQKLADWGVDFIKVDDMVPYPKEIVAIKKAIERTGRNIVYSLSPGGNTNLKDMPYYTCAQMVRITPDIWDDKESIDRSFKAWRIWQGMGYTGFWPDLDMVPFGKLQLMNPDASNFKHKNTQLSGKGTVRISKLNKQEMRTFITQRALAASPIMVGGDLPTLDDYSTALLTNKKMLECNQNGKTGVLVNEEDGLETWATSVASIQIKGWIGFFNRSDQQKELWLNKSKMALVNYYSSEKEKFFPGNFLIEDIWNNKKFTISNDSIPFVIESGDVLFISYEEVNEPKLAVNLQGILNNYQNNKTIRPERKLYGVGYHTGPLSVESLEKIASCFSVIEGSFRKEDMNAMRKFNPELKFIKYINGTYTNKDDYQEMNLIESEYRDGIEMFLLAGLASDINENGREFNLKSFNGEIPLYASTVSGESSKNNKLFVSWIRIDNELMRVDGFDPASGYIKVTRGFAGTKKEKHYSNANIFSPIYIGYLGWSGYPGADKETSLRYALSVSNERIYEYKAKILLDNMATLGYDGAKFDILGSVFYNMCDATGKPVIPWDFQKNHPYMVYDYFRQQERKIAFIQKYIFDRTGKHPILFGNSLSSQVFYPEDGGSMFFLMSTDVKPMPMNGFQMENFVSIVHKNTFFGMDLWKKKMNMMIHTANHNMGAVALIQFSDLHNTLGHIRPEVLQHEKFGYASYLLGVEPDESTYVGTPVFMELPGTREKIVNLFPQYFYQLGNPLESKEKIEMYKRPEGEIFQRQFEQGLVLVNPSSEHYNYIPLNRKYYDPETGLNVESVKMPSHTGKILLSTQ